MKQLELLHYIKIKGCRAICFIDELTLVAAAEFDNCIYKYTRKNEKSDDWTEDSQVEVE